MLWPAAVQVRSYTGAAERANRILFADIPPVYFTHFLAAIQLLWVVEESVCAPRITRDDDRVTYTRAQLLGQFEGVTYTLQHITNVMRQFDTIPAEQFLTGELLDIYRSSLCRADRLAAVICYFGNRDGN